MWVVLLNSSNSSSMISFWDSQLRMMSPSVLLKIKWSPPLPPQIPSQGRSVAEIKKHGGGADLQRIITLSAQKKRDIRLAVMSILRRAWAKYQQLLITHPWKTQTIGTGIVINEIPFLTWFVMKLMIDLRRHHLTQIIWVRWSLLKI